MCVYAATKVLEECGVNWNGPVQFTPRSSSTFVAAYTHIDHVPRLVELVHRWRLP